MTNLTAALAYEKLGFFVLPIEPLRKKPIVCWKDRRDKRPSPREIKSWWKKWPDTRVGCATGIYSGVDVIDIDSKKALDHFNSCFDFPQTYCSKTGKGYHFFFKDNKYDFCGFHRTRINGKEIDLRSTGDILVLPPSIYPKTGNLYKWDPHLDPLETENLDDLLKMPSDLITFCKGGNGNKEKKVLDINKVMAGVPEGERDDQIFRYCCRLEAKGLEWDESTLMVKSRCDDCTPPFPHDEGIKKLEQAWKHRDPKPIIYIKGGQLPEMITAAEDALLQSDIDIFQRGGSLCRITAVEATGLCSDGISRQKGVPQISLIKVNHLREKFTTCASFEKYDVRAKKSFKKDCPRNIAECYLERFGEWRVSPLRGVITTPTLRPDGSILDQPGYDEMTGLFLKSETNISIPKTATKKDAKESLGVLKYLISEFPFVNGHHRSVALAAILTSLIRQSIPTAPMFGFSSPTAGTGKSLLCDVISMISSGKPAAVAAQGRTEEELEKRIDAVLLQGDNILNLDNCTRPLKGQGLCQVITQQIRKIRILGHTKMVDVPCISTLLATGNNLSASGDMCRRILISRLDANMERPETREFEKNLYDYVPKHREEFVTAGLTILSAYKQQTPLVDITPMGGFEVWSRWIRESLLWLECEDPLKTQDEIRDNDPDLYNMRVLFNTWYGIFSNKPISTSKIIGTSVENDPLSESLMAILGETINAKKLGLYLKYRIDRVVDKYKLGQTKNPVNERKISWFIEKIP